MKNMLMTGADGFIGRNLWKGLKEDYSLICLITPGRRNEPENGIFSIDLINAEEVNVLKDKLLDKKFYAVIHLAFLLCKSGDWENFKYLELNNDITKNVISLCRNINVENLINFSSLAVYPNMRGEYTEESIVDPSMNTECLYCLAKFNSEVLFSHFLKDRMNVINLRMTQAYGPGMQEDRIVGVFRKELRENNTITVFGNGERISNFINIDDVVKSIQAVLEKPKAGTYNLGCHENVSYLEIAEDIVSGLGNDSSKIILKDKGIKAEVKINTEKFEKEFDCINTKREFGFSDTIL